MAGVETAQDSLREGLRLYEEGKYDETCAALDTFLAQYPANDTARFYLAMAHLNAERYARAVEILTPLTQMESSAFQLDATWYLGLCYLKVDDGLPKAKALFVGLSGNTEYKDHQAARGILRLLDE